MDANLAEKLQRLVSAGIQLLPLEQISGYFVFERDGYVSLVERTETGFGRIGASGLLVERGFAALVWRGGDAWFVAKGFEERATEDQVVKLRSFAADLENALR